MSYSYFPGDAAKTFHLFYISRIGPVYHSFASRFARELFINFGCRGASPQLWETLQQ
jgi:hypothetical protein